jgi:hypothetical protein
VAFGTPTIGTVAYSAQNGTSVAPSYPASIAADDVLVLIIGQKPSTANSGSVTTPTGWTLRESITGQGGYGATLGIDTGNTNLFIYTKDTVTGSETGTLSVTVGTNNVCWGAIVRIPGGGSTSFSVGSADGTRDTAPTVNVAFTVNLTNGGTATDFQSGDMAIWAMCIPTDVTTPSQFSAQSITATGATFGTAAELAEPDSGTGNDIGGYIARALVTAGSSTAAPSVTVTATGTVTNVRGPVALLRIRDTTQILTPSLYTNTNTFYTPTVTKGAVTLSPALFTNTNTFYSPDVTNTGGAQTLNPSLYTNTNTFYTPTVTSAKTLTPARYDNTNTFYTPTVTRGAVTLSPARYNNTNTFYTATVTRGAITLAPTLYTNTNTFYTATVTTTKTLTPARYDNTNSFYTATVTSTYTLTPARYDNTNTFYSPTVTQSGATELLPARYDNPNTFYTATVTRGAVTLAPARYDNTNSFYTATVTRGAVTLTPTLFTNTNSFYSATVASTYALTPARYDNTNTFYSPTVTEEQSLRPALFTNTNSFYTATVTRGAVTLTPSLYTNTNSFYSPSVTQTQVLVQAARFNNTNSFYAATATSTYALEFEDYYTPGYADPNYVGLAVENIQVWYTATLTPGPVTVAPSRYDNTNTFFPAVVSTTYTLAPARYNNTNAFYPFTSYQFWALRPQIFLNTNTFYPPRVIRNAPTPNWNPDTIASSSNFAGADLVANPNWTPEPTPPTPTFTFDSQTATPDWIPQ